jgi:uncharacterized membrane protein YgdD (TMEM256/DUF423 family)
MPKSFLIIGTILAGLAVVLGAFGAHGLKNLVGSETVSTYQTGVQYQMYHALALLFLGVLYERSQNSLLNFAGIFFIGGVVLFSGSLYLLASLKTMDKIGTTGIGLITPIGGLLFIIGWILLLISLLKK